MSDAPLTPKLGLIRAPDRHSTAQLLVATSAVLFGLQGILASLAYDHGASVGLVLAVRSIIFALLALFLLNHARRSTLRGHGRLIAIACIASVAGPLCYFAAIARMPPETVTMIVFLYPALTVLGARLFGRILLTRLAIGVTLMTMVGVALSIGAPVGNLDIVGIILSVSAAVIFATYFLAAERGLEGIDPLAWLGITTLAALTVQLPLTPLLGGFAMPDTPGIFAVLAVAILGSLLPCLFQTAGLMRLGSAATTLVATLEIATVVIAGVFLLGSRPGPITIAGALLVLIGAASAPRAMRRSVRLTSTL